MDWKVFLSTFGAVFLAELGDKTQFAAMAAGAQGKSLLSAWAGVVLALAIAGTAGVFLGSTIGNFLSPHVMRWTSGLLFVAVGVWVIVSPT